MNKALIIIAGPTAVGKTSTSIEIAEHYNTEIISADSRQIFKELQIGTAVPTKEELTRVPHHFIQTISIHDYYNASIFEQQVEDKLKQLFIKHDRIILTGGSGLYIKTVCEGIDDLPRIDPSLRQELAEKHKIEGIESLRFMLKRLDPDYYNTVDLKNHKRILKALEVSIMTGRPYSSFLKHEKKARDYQVIKICLNRDRKELYERINKRVVKMVEKGLVQEARKFYEIYKQQKLNSLNTVGYRELFSYFSGAMGLDEAIDLIKRNTRKYARKQISWFRREKDMVWFHPDETKEIIDYINKHIQDEADKSL
jgi:tRNA dimethylallyltransferase